MSGMYDRIAELCADHSLAVTALEDKLGFGRGSIGKIRTRGAMPTADRLLKIANYFQVSTDYLITGEDASTRIPPNVYRIEPRQIPVFADVVASTPDVMDNSRESYIMSGTDIHVDFCWIADGDSMVRAGIHEGDIVFIRRQEMVENGDIAAVVLGNDKEIFLRRFFYYPERKLLILRAENPSYEDLIFLGEERNEVRLIGKAIAIQSDLK